MKIFIVGCGKVGYALAEMLNEEGHELTVIDSKEKNLITLTETLDVMSYVGNGSSYRVLRDAGIESADLLIAVTDRDEVNLLSCLVARKASHCRTIARVRHPEYYDEIHYLQEELGLFMAINPEYSAANDILHLIQMPSAMEIDGFAKDRVNMFKFKLPNTSYWADKRIKDIVNKTVPFLVCVIERDGSIIIPNGDTILRAGDNVSIVTDPQHSNYIFSASGVFQKPIKDVIVAGGGTLSYYLAKSLVENKIKVKIIAPKIERCEVLSELLPEAIIIHGDPTNQGLLLEEGLEKADAFAALTDYDEENIMISLFANRKSKAKLITKVDKMGFEKMISDFKFPVGSVITPKHITAEQILKCVRSMKNTVGSNVEAVYRMGDNRVEALEFRVKGKCKVTNIALKNLNFKKDILICSIIRHGKLIIPTGTDEISINDTVIIVTKLKGLKNIEDILISR